MYASRPRILAVLLACAFLAAPAPARADGDPASHVLINQPAFLPYRPPVSQDLTAKLNKVLAAATKARYPMKVALIATPDDLGAIPSLFGRPQEYAGYLFAEIQPAFRTRFGLVIVMPAGIGLAGTANTPGAAGLLRDIKLSSGDADGLARAGAVAVQRLAKSAGHPIPEIVSLSGDGGGSSIGTRGVIITLELLGLALGLLLALRVRWRRAAQVPV